MHSATTVAAVLELRRQGLGARRIAGRTGLPVATVRDWLAGRVPANYRLGGVVATCPRCGHQEHAFDRFPPAYVYLLGLYLGDGCISAHARGVFRLRVFLDYRYPQIVDHCESAMRAVMPTSKVSRLVRSGSFPGSTGSSNIEVSSFSKAWPCLFPQHGPGKKHQRAIELVTWQKQLANRSPGELLRGLIHSDGCRFQNTGRSWSWPRYAFNNQSAGILRIFCDACDALDLHWTTSGRHTIYVSRKADVARLDGFIGPKR